MRTFSRTLRAPATRAIIVGIFVTLIYLLRSLSDVMLVGAFNDDGVYTALGKALAEGRGYVSIHLVGSPVQAKFPPVFPVLISFMWRVSGSVDGVKHLVGIIHPIVVGLVAGLLWWLGRTRYGVPPALLAIFAIGPLLFDAAIQYYTIPLSEPWFMLGWAVFLISWNSAERATGRARLVILGACGLLVALTVLTRSLGIVLIPAVILGLAGSRHSFWDRAVTIAAMAIPIFAWATYHAFLIARGPVSDLPDDVTYSTWLAAGSNAGGRVLMGSIAANIVAYVDQMGTYMSGLPKLGVTIAAVLLAAIAFGSFAILRRDIVLGLSTVGALVGVVVWPFAQDRLLLAVLPFCGLAFAAWAASHAGWSKRLSDRRIAYIVGVALVLFLVRQVKIQQENVSAFATSRAPASYSTGYMLLVNSHFIAQASKWIRANTARGDRLMIDNSPGVYLYTGRSTIPASPSESRLQASVFAKPGRFLASHILADSITLVIVGVPEAGIMRDIETVKAQCPGVLSWGGVTTADPQSIMKVRPDYRCLAVLAGELQ